MTDAPLDGVRVVEVGHIVAGPYASLVLADLGADVVKVEDPDGGDRARTADRTSQSQFYTFNRDKRSVALDLKSETGRERLYGLVRESDVVVENFAPGTVERLDVGYETLSEVNPELVYASLKGYADGPYVDRLCSDPIAEAMSGLMNVTGHPESGPARVGASPVDMMAGANAAISVLAALRHRDRTGEGQHVTVPLAESAVGLMGYWLAYRQMYGEEPERSGAALHGATPPYSTYPTRDGRVFVGSNTDEHWARIREVLDLDVGYDAAEDRRANREAVDAAIAEATRSWHRDDLVDALLDVNVPVAPVNQVADVLADPHFRAVDAFTEVAAGEDGEPVEVPVFPAWSDAYDVPGGERDPPEVGEHTEEVLDEFGVE